MFKEGIDKIWLTALDCVFPQSCLGCGTLDDFLCTDCQVQNTNFLKPEGIWLRDNTLSMSELLSLIQYDPDSVPGKLIESVKYGYSNSGILEIKQWVKRGSAIIANLPSIDLIIPIPLHKRREAERGFNQAELIARSISELLNKPISKTTLCRIKNTKQQAKLSKIDRENNVKDAFSVIRPSLIRGQSCLLVDDVYTTGSTMQAAAGVLIAVGAQKVTGFTLARAL